MEESTDAPKEIRRSLVLRPGASGRALTSLGSAAPEVEDIYNDDDSVFSETWDAKTDPHAVSIMCSMEGIRLVDLLKSYVPAPWFACTPVSYYAPEIRSKMGTNCIALVVVSNGLFSHEDPKRPSKIMIVPPEAGMYLRPITRAATPYRSESALPWVAYKGSPIIQAKIEGVTPEDFSDDILIQVHVSVLVDDIVGAASYYQHLMDPTDLSTFTNSLSSLDARSIKATLILPVSFPKYYKTAERIKEETVQLRLCFFFHEITLANYDPL